MSTKKFITALGLSTEITNFLLTGNKSDFSIFDIEKKRKGIVSFKTVTDFHKVEEHTMTLQEQGIWELFMQFANAKNATACLLKAIEDKSPITDKTFEMQTKITPKGYEAKHKAVKTYSDFIALMSKEQKAELETIASDYAKFAGFETSNFDFQHVNGENGLTLEAGQFVTLYDNLYGQRVWSQVYQASPKGQVTMLENDGTFTLSADTAKSIRIESPETTPEGVATYFGELITELDSATAERKLMKIERAEKIADAQALKAKADAEKAEKLEIKARQDKEAGAKSALAMKPIQKMKMDTLENIEKVVAKINQAIDLTPAHKKELGEAIKTAKAALRPKRDPKPEATAETAPEAPKAPKAPEAPATDAPAIIAGSKPARAKRATTEIAPATPAEATAQAETADSAKIEL